MALFLVIADQARSVPRAREDRRRFTAPSKIAEERVMGSSRPRRGEPAAYTEPFFWWGPVWTPPTRRSVIDLIQDGVMSARSAPCSGHSWPGVRRSPSWPGRAAPGRRPC